MPQNIYDDPDFFEGYNQLPRSVLGLEGAGEWPELRTLLPHLQGLRVLDLGCGFGWFCRWARQAGAVDVLGLDVSENMLTRARADTDDDAIRYERADLDEVELPRSRFDLAYSSLTLHYLRDLPRLCAAVHDALAPGGRFVCSLEHPTYTAPRHPEWTADAEGRPTWPLDGYLREGQRTTDWLAPGVIKQHRCIATYVRALLHAGFTLTDIREWGPTDEQLVEHPDWELERERSPFLFLAAQVSSGRGRSGRGRSSQGRSGQGRSGQ